MSLYVLDTDILSLFQRGHPEVSRNIAAHPLVEMAITVISVEEQISGWYTMLRRPSKPPQLALVYEIFNGSPVFKWWIGPYDFLSWLTFARPLSPQID